MLLTEHCYGPEATGLPDYCKGHPEEWVEMRGLGNRKVPLMP